jgi:hypothetical protein
LSDAAVTNKVMAPPEVFAGLLWSVDLSPDRAHASLEVIPLYRVFVPQ